MISFCCSCIFQQSNGCMWRGMAEHHPLQYWLESINLPQYYLNFSQHDVITREHCLALDEQRLADIGITMQGHQRRILSHLPSEETWSMDSIPNLPPKKKSVRDSFLFKDSFPNLGQDVIDTKTVAVVDTNSNTLQPDVGTDSPPNRVSPKPVPRPRVNKPKTPEPQIDDKPKPAPRPTPRKRSPLSSTSGNFEQGGIVEPSPVDEGPTDKGPVEVLTEENGPEKIDSDLSGLATNSLSDNVYEVAEAFAIPEQNVTSPSTSQTFNESQFENVSLNEPSKIDIVTMETDKHLSDESTTRPETMTLDGACEEETYTEGVDDEAECDDIYQNVDETNTFNPVTKNDNGLNATINMQGMSVVEPDVVKKPDYVNIGYDKNTDTFNLTSDKTVDKNDTGMISEPETPVVALRQDVKQSHDKPTPVDEPMDSPNEDSIYEPIWGNGKNEGLSDTGVRSSNLMNFSPKDLKKGSRFSTFGTRSSLAFDLPPPMFPPPPLPPGDKRDSRDLLQDFDPLAMPVIPAVPPRPQNYHPPKFNVYQNVAFHSSGGSTTLPGNDMEPDALCSPNMIGYQDAAVSATADPFNQVDPFGDFTPDESDFNPEQFPPSSCKENTNTSFVNPMTGSSFSNSRPPTDVYEVAQEPFDPFGLNQAIIESNLHRSTSISSGGSSHRLSEVPPAPKWPHTTIPEGNWFQNTNTDSMYSLANDISKYMYYY